MPKLLYVWKGKYPWDIRAEKVCNAFLRYGWEVWLLARWTEAESEREELNGINIVRTGFKKNSIFTQPLSINPIWRKSCRNIVEEINPDLIMPRDILLAEACGKIGKLKNIPVIMDMAEHYPAAMKGWKKYRNNFISKLVVHYLDIPELVEKRAVRLMDGIITVCQEQNIRLNKEFAFDLNKTCVVHNTPEKEFFALNGEGRKEKGEGRKEKGEGAIVFGHHGFTSDEKSLVKFLFGFEQAAQENERIELHIAGHGESIEQLRDLSFRFSSKERIKFSGKYDYNELPGIISQCDIGIVPYQLNDFNNHTIHNKVFDFFAMGKPVFCSETKPFLRLINETKAGISANCESTDDISEAILKMFDMDLSQMSKNGRRAFENKYNWEVDSANMLKFVEGFI